MKHAWLMVAFVLLPALVGRADEGTLKDAHALWQTGKYAEALQAYDRPEAASAEPISTAIGKSRCYQSMGQWEAAEEVLRQTLSKYDSSAELPARLAEVQRSRGHWEEAEALAQRALAIQSDHLLARWVLAQLAIERGQLDEANRRLEWFIHHYAEHELSRPEDLWLVGLAAQIYLRWNLQGEEQKEQLDVVLNDLFNQASKVDAHFWQGHYAAGLMWLETYAEESAQRDLKNALAINPQACEIHVALGRMALENYVLDEAHASCRRALEINPRAPEALQLLADLYLTEGKLSESVAELQKAAAIHARDSATLGRLAACYLMEEGPTALQNLGASLSARFAQGDAAPQAPAPEAAESQARFAQLLDMVLQHNPRPGLFLYTLGERLVALNQFRAAEPCFQQALRVMPQFVASRNALGMLWMRTGREEEAREMLQAAFRRDPFNVRTQNTLKVLDVLKQYEQRETPHFRIRFDGKQDALLARYMADYLEAQHPGLVEALGYSPQAPTLFEIFNDASPYEGHRRQSGHEWFSTRTVGLPEVHTIGACVGKVVALTSPEELNGPYNWARVAKHEYVHVLTLELTNFNIPHWFTEALAVHYEDSPMPAPWHTLLARRHAENRLLNLETINRAFIHPREAEDRTLAYTQALLYVRYMIHQYGVETIHNLLNAYRNGNSTSEAIASVFGVSQAEFEQGYRAYVATCADAPTPEKIEEKLSFAELTRAQQAEPENPDLAARLAWAQFRRKDYPAARRSASDACRLQKHHPLGTYVLARLEHLTGNTDAALQKLEPALDLEKPDLRMLRLLSELYVQQEQWERARTLYLMGRQRDPRNAAWLAGLVRVYQQLNDRTQLAAVLENLAELEQENVVVRKKLAQLALDESDFSRARRFAQEALYLDVNDAEVHRMLAHSHRGLSQWAQAAQEFQVTLQLRPDDTQAREGLSEAQQHLTEPKP